MPSPLRTAASGPPGKLVERPDDQGRAAADEYADHRDDTARSSRRWPAAGTAAAPGCRSRQAPGKRSLRPRPMLGERASCQRLMPASSLKLAGQPGRDRPAPAATSASAASFLGARGIEMCLHSRPTISSMVACGRPSSPRVQPPQEFVTRHEFSSLALSRLATSLGCPISSSTDAVKPRHSASCSVRLAAAGIGQPVILARRAGGQFLKVGCDQSIGLHPPHQRIDRAFAHAHGQRKLAGDLVGIGIAAREQGQDAQCPAPPSSAGFRSIRAPVNSLQRRRRAGLDARLEFAYPPCDGFRSRRRRVRGHYALPGDSMRRPAARQAACRVVTSQTRTSCARRDRCGARGPAGRQAWTRSRSAWRHGQRWLRSAAPRRWPGVACKQRHGASAERR